MKKEISLKKILSVIIAVAFIFTLLYVPSFNADAATGTVTNLKWVKTTKKKSTYTVSWTWDPFPGATGYRVVAVDTNNNVLADTIIAENSFSVQTKTKSQKIAFGVYVVDALGVSSEFSAVYGATAPVAPNSIVVWGWKQGTASVNLRWYGLNKTSGYVPTGYEIKTTTLDGKNKKVYKMKSNCSYDASLDDALLEDFTKNIKGCKNAGFKVSIRSYLTGPDGKKMYSDWSKEKAFVPAAQITKAVRTTGGGKAYWKPIKNATGYTIYKRNTATERFIKVKSVGAGTTSVTLPTSCFYDGIVITANVKVKGKTYKSTYMKQFNKYYNYYY